MYFKKKFHFREAHRICLFELCKGEKWSESGEISITPVVLALAHNSFNELLVLNASRGGNEVLGESYSRINVSCALLKLSRRLS